LRAVELLAPLIDDIWNLNERFTLAFAENVDLMRFSRKSRDFSHGMDRPYQAQ
jgi:hypothetical protein